MKKSLLFSLFCLIISLSSCSDDNDPINLSDKVTVSYNGYAIAACQYFDGEVSEDQTVVITAADDMNKVNVNYTSDSWGTFTFENATVVETSGSFVITGEGTTLMGMGDNVKEYKCELSGKIDASKLNPSFTFTVPAVMGGMTITFYPGEYSSAE